MRAAPHPEVAVEPFDLRPSGDEAAAVLCIHGLTGTPYEVRPIAEALVARGFRARGPRLPGHGTVPEDLVGIRWQAWLDAVRAEAEKLRAEHDRVHVAGLSLGGVLTLALAAEGLADAIAVVATPLHLRPAALPLLIPIAKRLRPFLPKRDGSDIRDPEARERHPGYRTMPLAAVHELIRLQRFVRPRLSRITAPILVAHGAHDSTAHPDDARRIAAEVASDTRRLLFLERSGHVVPVDYDGERLAASVCDFLTRL